MYIIFIIINLLCFHPAPIACDGGRRRMGREEREREGGGNRGRFTGSLRKDK